jgi:hypothetical protein
VRHNPPFTARHWVTTTEGRRSHLGSQLICVACSAPLSDSAVLTVPNINAPVWDQTGSAMSGKASAREIEKTEEIGMTQKQNTNSLISLRELIKEVFREPKAVTCDPNDQNLHQKGRPFIMLAEVAINYLPGVASVPQRTATAVDWFALFQNHRLLGLRNLGLFESHWSSPVSAGDSGHLRRSPASQQSLRGAARCCSW